MYQYPDKPKWAFTTSGNFTLKSAYNWLTDIATPHLGPSLPWKTLWKIKELNSLRKRQPSNGRVPISKKNY